MIKVSSFIAGLLFDVSLLMAGMANPGKVLAFLDLAGTRAPSLGLVMVTAIAGVIGPLIGRANNPVRAGKGNAVTNQT
ncbi:hypothetical protein D3C75_920790 [compost metagenome]